jgi:hypothetical protein
MVVASMTLEGTGAILAKFGGIAERLQHPEPALNIVADLLEAHVALNFATAGARVGRPWAPLAPSTVRARTRRWGYYRRAPGAGALPGGPPLRWTGDLAASFRQGSPLHIRAVTATSLTWGSDDPRAKYHQSTAPRHRLPRRPPIAFASDFQQREIAFTPLRLWLQGVPAGAIASVTRARLGL